MFNTLKYAKKLEEVGMTRAQAETHVEIIAEVIEDQLATKDDMKQMKNELVQMEYRLTIKLGTIVTVSIAAFAALVKFF